MVGYASKEDKEAGQRRPIVDPVSIQTSRDFDQMEDIPSTEGRGGGIFDPSGIPWLIHFCFGFFE